MTENTHTWREIVSQPEVWCSTLETLATDRAALEGFLDQAGADNRALVVGRDEVDDG